jgi:hypothetical protein
MATIAEVATAMQRVLTTTADTAARTSGCVQRVVKFTGATLVQTLVFGWLADPAASLSGLCQTAAARGVAITPQGLAQRFTAATAACLRAVLEATLTEVITADPVAIPLLARFSAVYVQDSTTLALPDALQDQWRGCDGRTAHGTAAALKAQVRLDLRAGRLHGPVLQDGRAHDQRGAPTAADLEAGALLLTDLGYFCLDTLAAYSTAGIAWLTRLKVDTILADATGTRGTVADLLARQPLHVVACDVPVQVGARHHLPARLLAVRVPAAVAAERRRVLRAAAQREGLTPSAARLAVADWTFSVTNVPAEHLTLPEALVLARARWQIELVFKRWKSLGRVDDWRSQQPWRVLCEVYAKLIGQVLAHWVTVLGAWHRPDRSLWQATRAVQQQALHLASVFDTQDRFHAVLTLLAFELAVTCRMNPRKARPNAYQLLLDQHRAA